MKGNSNILDRNAAQTKFKESTQRF